MNKGFSIAIDGPIASGKGTVANALANKLDGIFMSTGSMYRAVSLVCLERGIDINNEKEVERVLPDINVEYFGKKILLNNKDVTDRIRQPDVTHGSSVVAVYAKIRKSLVEKQQQIAKKHIDNGKIVIADGRDTGTKVFPDAALKIFLTATLEVRAKRSVVRYKKSRLKKSFEEIVVETKLRDERDSNRKIDPLQSSPEKFGYWVLDNSNQTEDETISIIIKELEKRGLIKND